MFKEKTGNSNGLYMNEVTLKILCDSLKEDYVGR